MAYTNTPEVAAGKMAQYMMTTAQGDIMYGQVHYKNIEPYSLLVYTQNFCDEKGNLSKPTFAPTWPNSMLTTVSFYDEGENESRVTVKWEIDGEATEQEKQTFRAAKAGMSQGWTGSFDKLEQAFR